MEHSLIANSGIQVFTLRLKINVQDHFKMWFHEWYDEDSSEWKLELLHVIHSEDGDAYYFKKAELLEGGWLANQTSDPNVEDLRHANIHPIRIEDENCEGVIGDIFSLTFSDKENKFKSFENEWIPIPYFLKRGRSDKFNFGPLNWSRMKFISAGDGEYDVVLAFDTRTNSAQKEENEKPFFQDNFCAEIKFDLCGNDMFLLDYCSAGKKWSYVDEHLMHLAHPGIAQISQLRGNGRKMSYVASYIHLICYLAKNELLPTIKLYKDVDVEVREVDMVVDVGNSRTTALLIEDNTNFNQVRPLELVDYTDLLRDSENGKTIRVYDEPFDMRLAFRKVEFGNFGHKNNKQFVYPSLVRLGQEANNLIHRVSTGASGEERLSTYSSPKRYLWDFHPNKEEWKFLVLPGENDEPVLNVVGITSQLKSDGTFDPNGNGGLTFHYSRRSLMTLSFLEMFVQAQSQINSIRHRSVEEGFGHPETPRRIKRVIVTCPTAMSELERKALIGCAQDAVKILANFNGDADGQRHLIEVVPSMVPQKDDTSRWYYDEATCSQLVYMYGEVGHKYKGHCDEYFNLYGKVAEGETQASLTVGSLDIGAGTSDLMISRYVYEKGNITTITPEPLFYDSFYFAGDDMLNGLIRDVMLLKDSSAFRQELKALSDQEYRQKIKDFFGQDYNGQTLSDRILRKDFNIQYSVPLMCHFLELVKEGSKDCVVRYNDVFEDCPPNDVVIEGFKEHMGIDITKLDWKFNKDEISLVVEKEFEPLLKKIATMMYAHACDIVLLSGRPASLPAIRNLFLKYYAVSPNRLIILNNYYVGDWYPFSSNTGFITNPKTIVAMGGIIGHYAAELSKLNKFVIKLDKLKKGLKSTVNYVEMPKEGRNIEYVITPEQNQGDLMISCVPTYLNVRQIEMKSYPGRVLYVIDFNRHKMADKIRRKASLNSGDSLTDAKVQSFVNENIEALKKRMPFKLTIERNIDDQEQLSVVSVFDKAGNDVMEGNMEIHIQSLGADEKYWLDSGAFNF